MMFFRKKLEKFVKVCAIFQKCFLPVWDLSAPCTVRNPNWIRKKIATKKLGFRNKIEFGHFKNKNRTFWQIKKKNVRFYFTKMCDLPHIKYNFLDQSQETSRSNRIQAHRRLRKL